jgi:hypothetical protein
VIFGGLSGVLQSHEGRKEGRRITKMRGRGKGLERKRARSEDGIFNASSISGDYFSFQ